MILMTLIMSVTFGSPDYQTRLAASRVANVTPLTAAAASLVGYWHPDAEVFRATQRLWPHRFSKWCRLTRLLRNVNGGYMVDWENIEEVRRLSHDLRIVRMDSPNVDEYQAAWATQITIHAVKTTRGGIPR